MKDTYISARLVAADCIRFVSLSDINYLNQSFILLIDRKERQKLFPSKTAFTPSHSFIEFKLAKPLELGHSYFLFLPGIGEFPLDVSEATTFPTFDKDFYFSGELGAIYSKEKTTWRLWAPLASSVKLFLLNDNEEISYMMKRGEHGVFSLTLEGDFNLQKYLYFVTNNEIGVYTIDPYAKGSTENAKTSVVIDPLTFDFAFHREELPPFKNPLEAVIYEGNVRDLTIDKYSSIENKGKYLGLAEENRKTIGGHPISLDYLKELGITHLQLQPLNDFGSVDEEKGFEEYNWGYDPIQYFVPEGSYSSSSKNPLSRIQEIQKMVSTLHKNGIRVVLDVVFNHVYEYAFSSFEKVVPNYYFRKDKQGKLTNSSGCGDDFSSERPMVRKMIVDSCLFWQKAYGIDGLRFDLMGLIDVETMQEIAQKTKEMDPSFLLYGEGWDMYIPQKVIGANMNQCSLLPEFAFFNDCYRENMKSYCAGDLSKQDGFTFSLLGSSFRWGFFEKKFLFPSQSLNYIECHDNGTYYDFLSKYFSYSEEEKIEIIKFSLACLVFSFGIPFLHMGQEIGQSKFMKENTYNLGDVYNKLSDKLLDSRYEMVQYVSGAIALRKSLDIFKISDPTVLERQIDFERFDAGSLMKVKDLSQSSSYQEIDFLFNPTSDALAYSFEKDHEIIFTSGGPALGTNILAKNVLIPRHSLLIVALKK